MASRFREQKLDENAASHELEVLDITPADFIGLSDMPDLDCDTSEVASYSRLLHDSPPPLHPLPTVVSDLPKNGHSIHRLQRLSSSALEDAVQDEVLASELIPSTVEDFADSAPVRFSPDKMAARPTTSRSRTPKQSELVATTSRKQQVVPKIRTKKKNKLPSVKFKQQSLPEFLINTLRDKTYNPSIIKWENAEKGIFKIEQGKQLAQLWRTIRRKNISFKYEFFARAMRYYYKRGYIKRVAGRKLIYQFQEKYNWRRTIITDKSSSASSSDSHNYSPIHDVTL